MTETWDQMEARHARERAELMQATALKMYRAGLKRSALDEFSTPSQTLRSIAEQVAVKHDLSLADLKSASRMKPLARARFEYFARAHEAGFSLPQIGRTMNRDHTTVLNGIRRHKELSQ